MVSDSLRTGIHLPVQFARSVSPDEKALGLPAVSTLYVFIFDVSAFIQLAVELEWRI